MKQGVDHLHHLPCLAAAIAAAALSACVADVDLPKIETSDTPAQEPGDGVPPGSPPVSPAPPPPREPLPQRLRALSGAELRATVRAVVGVELDATIDHRHIAAGFDTSADGQVHDALLAALVDELTRVGRVAVTETLVARFPCLTSPIDDGCRRAVVAALAPVAWRRPAPAARIDELVAFASAHSAALAGERAPTGDDDRAGVAAAVTRVLLSPECLYRQELRGTDGALDGFAQAELLAYALTGAPPDDALRAAAEDISEEALATHARRLIDTGAGRARVADLIRQWVRATALDDMAARPADFTKLASPSQGRALKSGFDAFVRDVAFDNDGSLAALLTTPIAYVNGDTAALVGADISGETLVAVALPDSERRGLLTQPGLLAAHGASGEADKDRPVLRGYMVKTQLLCEPIGPPSGLTTTDAANAAAGIPGFDELTTRAQYEAMMEQGESCSACHAQFMPLGFAFGRYDALGRYREEQHGQAVDASALGVPFLGHTRDFADGLALSDALAEELVVAACFAQNVAAFVTGQGTSPESLSLGATIAHGRDTHSAIVDVVVDAVVQAATRPRSVEAEPPPVADEEPGVVPDDNVVGVMPDDGANNGNASDNDDAGVDPAEILLGSGVELRAGDRRAAHGGALTLTYQGDGNLVLYERNTPRWASRTDGEPAHITVMQGDGNLVVYARPGNAVFHTGTNGSTGATLWVRRSGTLEVRASDGRVLRSIAPTLGAP